VIIQSDGSKIRAVQIIEDGIKDARSLVCSSTFLSLAEFENVTK